MSGWARPGVKCVCVDDGDRIAYGTKYNKPPPKGTICTIVGSGPSIWKDGISLSIEGFPNFCPINCRDIGWHVSRFRPLTTRSQEQDLEQFLPLLTPVDA